MADQWGLEAASNPEARPLRLCCGDLGRSGKINRDPQPCAWRAQHPAKEAAGKPQPAAKKKAGRKAKSKVACKKPATVLQDAQDSESAEEAPAGAPARAPEDAVKPTERLRKEYRSATNSVSIRAIWRDDEHKEKKRQLFELRGLDAISKEKFLELAEESCAKILEGQDEATVKSWALDELNKRKNV